MNTNKMNSTLISSSVSITGVLTALVAVSAFIRIPFPMMPFTMQVLIVLLAPMVAGLRCSFAAIAIYIMLGLAGLPIFAGGGGPAYTLVPSFGFLIGFLLSTIPSSIILSKRSGFFWNLAAGLSAMITYEIVGLAGFWLNMIYVQGKAVSLGAAFVMSVLPFIVPDLIKLVIAALIAGKIKKTLSR